jgi:hypothetical protein
MVVSREDRIPSHETAMRKININGPITLIHMIHDQVLHRLHVLITFSFVTLGMLIGYGDESFDVDRFDRRKVKALAVLWGIHMGWRPSSQWFIAFLRFDLGISQAGDITIYRGCRSAPL